jgi:hypothetical protein
MHVFAEKLLQSINFASTSPIFNPRVASATSGPSVKYTTFDDVSKVRPNSEADDFAMAGKHRSYTVKYKLDVIQWHRDNGAVISITARRFDVDRKRVREWIKQEDALTLNRRGKSSMMKRLHPGGQFNQEHDMIIVDFLIEERAAGRPVSNYDIQDKAKEEARQIGGMEDFKASSGWLHNWKKRNHIGIRRGTNESQKIPEDYADKVSEFTRECRRLRQIHDYTDYNIANMDQTMCRFDMAANTTNSVRGERDIRISTGGGSKKGFTVALCASADGTKKPAYVVLKEPGGRIPPRVFAALRIPRNIRLTNSQNGWMTGAKITDWIERVWGRSQDDTRRLLVLDQARIHTMQATKDTLEGN